MRQNHKLNRDIRSEIAAAGLRMYEVAEEMGMQDSNFSRMFRKELSEQQKERIRECIRKLA